jgi:hypothetical protein
MQRIVIHQRRSVLNLDVTVGVAVEVLVIRMKTAVVRMSVIVNLVAMSRIQHLPTVIVRKMLIRTLPFIQNPVSDMFPVI